MENKIEVSIDTIAQTSVSEYICVSSRELVLAERVFDQFLLTIQDSFKQGVWQSEGAHPPKR